MNTRIRILLLFLAFSLVSGDRVNVVTMKRVRRQSDRTLQNTPTSSPIVPLKDQPDTHAEKPKKKPEKNHDSNAVASGGDGESNAGDESSVESSSGGGSDSGGSHSVVHHSSPSHHSSSSSSSSSNHDDVRVDEAAHGAAKPLLFLIGAAASSLVVAAYAKSRRRVVVVPDHPLKGSIGRRMKLFGDLAGRRGGTLDRSVMEENADCYRSADDIGIAVV